MSLLFLPLISLSRIVTIGAFCTTGKPREPTSAATASFWSDWISNKKIFG
jgi:hypothetical protein